MEFMEEASRWQTVSIEAAKKAGEIVLSKLGKVVAKEKNPRDLVTEADLESQAAIKSILLEAFPDHGFLGEEDANDDSESAGNPNPEFCWVVDPIDGTTNFVHQLPGFCISIALRRGDKMVLGTIYDPTLDECFTAVKGRGAELNGQPISNSGCVEIEKSLLVCSFPSRVTRESNEVRRFLNVLTQSTVRRSGSAALNLAYVACGRYDGYWATSLNLWDMAAGYVIASEAGAMFSHVDGGDVRFDDPKFVCAATKTLHQQLLKEM